MTRYSGLFTLSQQFSAIGANTWPIIYPEDPYFYANSLLLNGDGTNGAQNNTFLDSSTNNFTLTRNGNTTQGSFSPYGSLWSNYQPDAIGGYFSFATGSGSNFEFTGDFTIEGWVNNTTVSTDTSFYVVSNGGTYFALNIDMVNGVYNLYLNSGSVTYSVSSGIAIGQWTHVAMVRSGSTITLYTNGTARGTVSNSGTLGYASPAINRNGGGNPVYTTPRYMSNLRIVKGTAVYTTNFTPPTTPLTAISGTSLLICQSNRFIDNSSNAYTLTISGSPTVQRFSPFNPTDPYSTTTNGGSGYFDGSGDYLLNTTQVTNQFTPTSGFTLDFWVYQTATQAIVFQVAGSSNSWNGSTGILFSCYANYSGTFYWQWNSGGATYQITGTGVPTNQWSHVAVGYNGSTTRVWINGSSIGTSGNGYAVPSYSKVSIGNNCIGSGDSNLSGYMSDVRFIKGTDIYGVGNSTITVPTAPLTPITNTQLLTNFTNAGIPDLAMMNNLETVGNAQVSTSVVKYGTGSLAFDGTGDSLLSTGTLSAAFGTGDFTIEFWLNLNTTSPVYQGIIDTRPSGGASANAFLIYLDSSGTLYYFSNSTSILSYSPINTSTWIHVAVTRNSGSLRLFINGAISGSPVSNTINLTETRIIVGNTYDNYGLNGYIDDLRVTKGLARYTANFTPPTAALPTY
jgi:hypothetical protein